MLITPGFSADETDWCIPALLDLVRSLANQHEVTVFALRYPHRPRSYRVFDATVQALGGGFAGGLRRGPVLARALAALVREGRRQRFDVVHGFWADEAGALAVAAGRLLHVPSIVTVMGGELVGEPDLDYGVQLSKVGRRLVRWSLPRAHRVTVGSRSVARLAQAYVAVDRLREAPLGVDTALFRPDGPIVNLRGGPRLLHVASLTPVKDQATLLQALALLAPAFPNVHLHLVGEGPLQYVLELQAHTLGLSSHVTFHGAAPHELTPSYYRGADLFVLSSRYESQSMVVLEAAACGCPIVGTTVGMLPELLLEYSQASLEYSQALPEYPQAATCLAPPANAEALALVVAAACRDADHRRRLGETLQRPLSAAYSLSACVETFVHLYEEVA